jgi:aminoglycoside phosphotransferase (APT) family kinase protein
MAAVTLPVTAAALREWVERATEGRVLAWEALAIGNSRATFAATLERDGEPLELIVRHDAGGGPVAGTELTLEREAGVYRALAGRDIPIPRAIATSREVAAVAVERIAGTPQAASTVLDELLSILARLHGLAPAKLELPGFAGHAAADLDLWERIAGTKLAERDELVDIAFAILRERFPGEPPRIVLCHGDYGEGNFLVEGGRVSGLLDWEFAHVGDPHDDLAWLTVRAALFGRSLPGFARAAREVYAPASGVDLSPARLRFWQAAVILRNLICCLAVAAAPDPCDRSVHLMLIPGLRYRLVRMLAELCEVELDAEPPADPGGPPDGRRAEIGDALLRELASGLAELAAEIPDAEPRRRARRLSRMAAQFAESWRAAAAAGDLNEADRARTGPGRAELLRRLGRTTARELALLPRSSPIADAAVADLEE